MSRKVAISWKIIDRALLPAICFLSSLVAVTTFWQLLLVHRRAEIQQVTDGQAVFAKSKLELELRARISLLEQLAARWRPSGEDSDNVSAAQLILAAYPDYQSLEFVDPTLHVRWATPGSSVATSSASSLGIDPAQTSAFAAAAQNKKEIVLRPTGAPQTQQNFLVCVPVIASQKLAGFLVGAFRYRSLISSDLQDVAPRYWVAIYDGDTRIYGEGAKLAPRDAEWASTTDVRVRDVVWRVRVWPKPGTVTYALSTLPKVELIGGLLISALLAFTVYSAESSRLYAKEVVASNKSLKSEIAQRELAEESLRRSQKMEAIGRLAGGVAHDFNNLLTVIRGHAALSLNRDIPDPGVVRELNEIIKTSDKASALTRRLLSFSRKQVLQFKVLDLNAIVHQVSELLPPVLGEDVDLVLDLDPNLGRVKADSAQMEQAIMNLVFNARDAMSNGGELKIQTMNAELDEPWVSSHGGAQAGPHVMLAVRDTGHGMTDEILSHIFEPFFTTKDIDKGTGLGLASVYGTVRQSGGFVSVLSRVGEGTTFQIYLPRVEAIAEAAPIPISMPQPQHGVETILVVEDNDAVLRMTREFLKIKGYSVLEAPGAAEAIQLMEKRGDEIDLVLTDVLMPNMKGRELVERLSTIRSDLKVLYMSAYTEDAAINIGVLNPGTEFIEKPFSPDELAAKIRRILGRSPQLNRARGA
jgi:signal transduction histidine kinase/CheY-like chemotaxis protein